MLLQRLEVLEPGSIPVGGTDFTVALEEANHLLTEDPPPGSAIFILSDGDNVSNDPKEVVRKLAQKGLPIFALAFGDDQVESPIPGSSLRSMANYSDLKEFASSTDGFFAQGRTSELNKTIERLNIRIDAIELFGDNIAPEIYHRPLELYAYPLTLALILLVLHILLPLRTKQWHALSALWVISFLTLQPLSAEEDLSGYQAAQSQAQENDLPLVIHFIGSDWSKISITFEREILTHPVYQKWEKSKAVSRIIDLPRSGISAERRKAHRKLAKKFGIQSYPTSVFIKGENEAVLGQLTHDPAGPASWVKRANKIISGNRSASDSAASIKYLPEVIQNDLEDESLTADQRSLRLYNKAIEMERAAPKMTFTSEDRFKLLMELYGKSAAEATNERLDLRFAALRKQGLLHHKKGRLMVPDLEDEKGEIAQQPNLENALKTAIKSYRKALEIYRQAIPLIPGDEELTINFATAYRDLARAKHYLEFIQSYSVAVSETVDALTQETQFRRSLDQDVTTSQPVNKEAIEKSIEAIQDLLDISETIEEKPTILSQQQLSDFRLAKEDIVLAPTPHDIRDLHPSTLHIKNALEHLIDPQMLQQQPQTGEREEDPSEENPEGDQDEEGKGGDLEKQDNPGDKEDRESDLRRAGKEQGDLRGRLLNRLGREGKYVPRSQDK